MSEKVTINGVQYKWADVSFSFKINKGTFKILKRARKMGIELLYGAYEYPVCINVKGRIMQSTKDKLMKVKRTDWVMFNTFY